MEEQKDEKREKEIEDDQKEMEAKIKRKRHNPAAPHRPLSSCPLMVKFWFSQTLSSVSA